MMLLDAPRQLAASASKSVAAPRPWSRALAVVIPTVLVGVHTLAYGRWIVDDAGITFAYARSVATGAGPVLQPGAEPVEGYSNPAWLALLVLGRWLGIFDHGAWFGVPDYVAFPKLLALACCAGVFACFYAVARATTSRPVPVTIVAGAVTAAVPSFVIWTMSGLENALLALAAAAIAAVVVRAAVSGRLLDLAPAVQCGLLAALAALTRPDGLVYVAAYPLVVLVLAGRGQVRRWLAAAGVYAAAFAVPAGAYLGWRLATFGEYLPNTALAKAQGVPGLQDLSRPAELIGYVGWLTAVFVVLLIGAALARPWPGRPGLVALLVPLGLAVAAFMVLQPDWMGEFRFATPVWALGALAATIAAVRVWPMLVARGRAIFAVVAACAVMLTGSAFLDGLKVFRASPTVPLCVVAQNTGRNFADYARIINQPNATVLSPDVGGAALASPLGVIDLAGLANARIARYWHDGNFPAMRDYMFDEIRPTFIKSHSPWSGIT
jgi:hypothetical protein